MGLMGTGMESLRRLDSYLSDPSKTRTIRYCIILSIIATGLFYTIPYICGVLLQQIVDMKVVKYEMDYQYVVDLCGVLVFIVIFWFVSSTESVKRLTMISLDTTRRMRQEMNRKMMHVPLSFLESIPPGDLTARFTNDLPTVGRMIASSSAGFFIHVTMIFAIVVMMLLTSPDLGLIYVLLMPVTLFAARHITKSTEADLENQRRKVSDLNSVMSDIITSHRTIKTENAEAPIYDRFMEADGDFTKSYISSKILSSMIGPVLNIISNIGYVATVIFGAALIIWGNLDIGMFFAFLIYVRIINTPLTKTAEIFNTLRDDLISLDRVMEVLEAPEEDVLPDSGRVPSFVGRITFEDVDFSYRDGHKVLDGVSFETQPGRIMALVGPTGSGKSTVANLIMGFSRPDRGRVLIDGVDISCVSRTALFSGIGAVLQYPWVFDGTIRENVVYTNPSVSEEELLRYSRLTGLDDYVRSLPDGYDTVIGSDLRSLPLAQARMVALTRLFLRHPKILVLDEAVAGIDPITGQSILDGLKDQIEGRTVILITHNAHLISQADYVLRMEGGKVVPR